MSQVSFGSCVPEFKPIPDMRVPFNGYVSKIESRPCISNEKSRRDDGLKPSFGNGTPTMNPTGKWGLAHSGSTLAYANFDTLEGSLKLPTERAVAQYLPSVDTLDFLTHTQGTRLQPIPQRYYR